MADPLYDSHPSYSFLGPPGSMRNLQWRNAAYSFGQGLLDSPPIDQDPMALARAISSGAVAFAQTPAQLARLEEERRKKEIEEEERRLRMEQLIQNLQRGETELGWDGDDRRSAAERLASEERERLARIDRQRAVIQSLPERYRAEAELQVGTDAFDKLMERVSEETAGFEFETGPQGVLAWRRGTSEGVSRPPVSAARSAESEPTIVERDGFTFLRRGPQTWSAIAKPGEGQMSDYQRESLRLRMQGEIFDQLTEGSDRPGQRLGPEDVKRLRAEAAKLADEAIGGLAPSRPAPTVAGRADSPPPRVGPPASPTGATTNATQVVANALAAMPPAERTQIQQRLQALAQQLPPDTAEQFKRAMAAKLAAGESLLSILAEMEAAVGP